MQNYSYIERLGAGTYGEVWKAMNNQTQQIVAIKTMKNNSKNFHGISEIALREISIMKSLNHYNIIKVLEVFQHDLKISMVLEYCDTNLYRYLHSKQIFEKEAKDIIFQTLKAIAYCHQNGIIHRDLAPANVLLKQRSKSNILLSYQSQYEVKIADFGLSRSFNYQDVKMTHDVVTRYYRAPEVIINQENYNEKIDVWSIACIWGEMLLGNPIFEGQNEVDQLTKIYHGIAQGEHHITIKEKENEIMMVCDGFQSLWPKLENVLSVGGIQLMKKMLQLDISQRYSADQCLEDVYWL